MMLRSAGLRLLIGFLPGICAVLWSGCSEGGEEKPTGSEDKPSASPGIVIEEATRSVSVPAAVAEQGTYKRLGGAIEYVLVAKGGKEYETLFITEHSARDIHAALLSIGLHAGRPATAEAAPKGQPVHILVEYERDGVPMRRPIEALLLGAKTGKPVPPAPWPFTGSASAADPATGEQMLGASLTGSIVGLHYSDGSPLFQNPRPECRQENIYKANAAELLPPQTPVRIIFQRAEPAPRPPGGGRRIHAVVEGRLASVGYCQFVERQGRQLKLTGFVRALRDGRVEALAEGAAAAVEQFLQKIRVGPRAARVERFEVSDERTEGDYTTFEFWR